jgi:type 1 glutamine amidotransferase
MENDRIYRLPIESHYELSRRIVLRHIPRMTKYSCLGFCFLICCALSLTIQHALAAETNRVRVLIVDGYSNHDWQRTTLLTRGILERSGLFEISVATAPASTNDPAYALWNPEFRNFDVVIQTCNDLGGRGPLWPEQVRNSFEQFVRAGGGVFVLHSGNNAFARWDAYNKIIGLGWRDKDFGYALRVNADESIEKIPPGTGEATSHGARTDRVIHRLGDDPVHAGFPRTWKTPLIEVYTYARGPAENVTVLSWAEEPKTKERWPIEWTVQYGQGRVYNSTFGHVWRGETDPVDMRCAGFQTILVRAVQWLAKRPVTFPVPEDFPTADNVKLRPLD